MTSSPLKILALDHFFNQDLTALENHWGVQVRRIPYRRLRRPALRIMGEQVGSGLEPYNSAKLASPRERYANWLRAEVRRLYLEGAFDVLVVPSDTLFYVRALPEAAHELGIPVIVVQKETTISVDTMESHSQEIGLEAPFISDWMTVCSERHREFWLRTGADGDRVLVTGQPRFDVYANTAAQTRKQPPQVLFLSYVLDAYVPGVGQGIGLRTWEALRTDTERVLIELAEAGQCRVLVKCHPHQNHRREADRLGHASASWGENIRIAHPDADTRQLLLDSDVVVGFQTTALYEAVAAGKPVVYAAWGEEYETHRPRLIPFHASPAGCVHWARNPAEFAELVVSDLPPPPATCRPWYEEALGPVDGCATERVVRLLTRVAREWPSTTSRRTLDQRRRTFAPGLLVRAGMAETVWTVAAPAARLAGLGSRAAARRRAAAERRRLAMRELIRPSDRGT